MRGWIRGSCGGILRVVRVIEHEGGLGPLPNSGFRVLGWLGLFGFLDVSGSWGLEFRAGASQGSWGFLRILGVS